MTTPNAGSQASEENKAAPSPPYIGYQTFSGCLDWLGEEGVPLRFDRSFWVRRYNGTSGPQVVLALRFLGLLKEDVPTSLLENLATANTADRKVQLLAILKDSYKTVPFDQLERATTGMLDGWLASYGLQSSTKRKVAAFLINALKDVGYPISNALSKSARNKPAPSATARPKPPKKPIETTTGGKPRNTPPPPKTDSNVRRVELKSGGYVQLEIGVDLFTLTTEDREFVMKLIDAARAYSDAS